MGHPAPRFQRDFRVAARAWLPAVLFAIGLANSSSAAAQAPIVVDLAVSALRGIAMGAGQRAGQEVYDRLRGAPLIRIRHLRLGIQTPRLQGRHLKYKPFLYNHRRRPMVSNGEWKIFMAG